MKMNHLLLEVYCDCPKINSKLACSKSNFKLGIHCFKSQCKYLSYTKCPNEIAYVNEEGITDNDECFIGYGGDMEPEDSKKRELTIKEWRTICLQKIDEAYKTYMEKKHIKY